MAVDIVAIGDTHCREWSEVHPGIREAVEQADVALHCGDFTYMGVVDGMRRCAKRAIVVHGNSDQVDVRKALPYAEVLEIEGVRIGVTHPSWGGPEFPLEELLPDFPEPVDAIVFGHFHVPINEERGGVLFVNPGQGYASFMVPCTIARLRVDSGQITVSIETVEPAR